MIAVPAALAARYRALPGFDARMRVPALVMDHVFGSRVLVGRISRRTAGRAEASFSATPSLPLIIRLKRASRTGVIRGSILNATDAVAAAGVCYRSLAANGKANPLVGGFSSRIRASRRLWGKIPSVERGGSASTASRPPGPRCDSASPVEPPRPPATSGKSSNAQSRPSRACSSAFTRLEARRPDGR